MITLCALMRDEEHRVPAMLAAAHEALGDNLSGALLCDTGSQDGSIEAARQTCRDLDIQLGLIERPWVNFGANRNELLDAARGREGWLLLLDTDMTIVANGPLPELAGDGYMVKVHQENLAHWLPLLVNAACEARYVGVTHEYLDASTAFPKLDAIWVEHPTTEGKRERFKLDRRLLESAVAEDPGDVRSVFYLAQTYRDLGLPKHAITTYARRADMGGWAEEAYYARFQQGVISKSWGVLLEAWEMRPTRGEALYEALGLLRADRMWRTAHLLSTAGAQLTAPSEDILFLEPWVYDWGLKFEHSITSYWVGELEQCAEISAWICNRSDVPDWCRDAAARNREIALAAADA